MKSSSPVILLLVGPSCSGKSTLEKALVAKGAAAVISNTTRAPRAGEVDGESYHFRTKEWFDEQSKFGSLVERVEFSGNLYGNTLEDIRKAFHKSDNGVVVWVVEPNGMKQIKQYFRDADMKDQTPFIYTAFINGDEDVRLDRLAARLTQDIHGERSMHAVKAKLVKALDRVKTMTSVERVWVKEAQESLEYDAGVYNCIINKFDSTNEDDVVEFLTNISSIRRLTGEIEAAGNHGMIAEKAAKEAILASDAQVGAKEPSDDDKFDAVYRSTFGITPTSDARRRLTANLKARFQAESESNSLRAETPANPEQRHAPNPDQGAAAGSCIPEGHGGKVEPLTVESLTGPTKAFVSELRLLGIPYQLKRIGGIAAIRIGKSG
jgi:guanylate kinase